MNRHKEKEKMEFEIEKEIAKTLIEEIRFNRNQLWKIGYYGVIIYATIFTVIRIFKDMLSDDLKFLAMYYYTLILITASISVKIAGMIYDNNIEYRRYYGTYGSSSSIEYKAFEKKLNITHPDNEQFIGILFLLLLGYYLSIIYVCSIYGFNSWIIGALLTYLGLEAMLIYYRRKTVRLIKFDITTNMALLFLLYLIYIVYSNKVILLEYIKYLNK